MNEELKTRILIKCMSAPAWAKYACVDDNGCLCVYEERPIKYNDRRIRVWDYEDNHDNEFKMISLHSMNMEGIDWTETLMELL